MLRSLPKFSLSLLFAATLCTSAFGDTVVLTTGEKIEGKVIKETDAEVVVETKAGGIVDERTLKRSEVASVDKDSPDEAPWQAIRNFKLGDNSMPAAQYDTYLGPMKSFLTQFPESKHKGEVEKMVADFEAEKQRVTGGERKLTGKWLSKEDVQRESYQINGAIALNFMRDQAARNDLVGAMNTFDLLEKQYPGSRSYVDAVDFARRLTATLRQQAEARLARLPSETAEREKGVQLARASEKAQIQAELDREKQNNAAALEQAKQQNRKWMPFLPRSEEALQQIVQVATEESRRLGELDISKQRESIRAAEQAQAALAKKDLTAAEESLKKAQELWSENELVARLDKELTAAKDLAESQPAPATEEKKPDDAASSTTADKPPTPEGEAASTAAADEEEKPRNPVFTAVLALVIAGVAYAAWKAYSSVRKKANEVIE